MRKDEIVGEDMGSGLDGIVPAGLAVRQTRLVVESLEVMADIGFHDFEIGVPQRLLVTVEIWLDGHDAPPANDDPAGAWNYDVVVSEIRRLAGERRYNLQETLVHRVFERVAALHGVAALRVRSAKPDVYPDVERVGVEIASFKGVAP